MRRNNQYVYKWVLSALFLAIGLVLPFFTMQMQTFGNMLLPMHLPVMLCGFLCGWPYGLCVGLILPIMRGMIFGMPMLLPTGVAMAAELAVYGFLTGFLYERTKKNLAGIYLSLIAAMIGGRIVWGIVSMLIYQGLGDAFTWKIFVVQGFVNAVPGIIIQLILIPVIVNRLNAGRHHLWN